LNGITAVEVILALVAGYIIWRISIAIIRMLSTPPPEVNPEDVVTVDQDYRCTVCGAELTMPGGHDAGVASGVITRL
jgi:hypothetical protein